MEIIGESKLPYSLLNVHAYYIQGVSKGSLQNFRGDSRHEDNHY